MVDLPRPSAPRRRGRDISHHAAPAWQATTTPVRGGFRDEEVIGADFPYALHSAPDPAFLAAHGLRRRVSPDDPVEKRELIEGYRTQVDALFPGGQVPPRAEEYYTRA